MAVVVRHRSDALTAELYDQVSGPLLETVKGQPGFLYHVAFEDSKGFCVSEVWETQEQHDAWFNTHVVPNVPVEISQEVAQVHTIQEP